MWSERKSCYPIEFFDIHMQFMPCSYFHSLLPQAGDSKVEACYGFSNFLFSLFHLYVTSGTYIINFRIFHLCFSIPFIKKIFCQCHTWEVSIEETRSDNICIRLFKVFSHNTYFWMLIISFFDLNWKKLFQISRKCEKWRLKLIIFWWEISEMSVYNDDDLFIEPASDEDVVYGSTLVSSLWASSFEVWTYSIEFKLFAHLIRHLYLFDLWNFQDVTLAGCFFFFISIFLWGSKQFFTPFSVLIHIISIPRWHSLLYRCDSCCLPSGQWRLINSWMIVTSNLVSSPCI